MATKFYGDKPSSAYIAAAEAAARELDTEISGGGPIEFGKDLLRNARGVGDAALSIGTSVAADIPAGYAGLSAVGTETRRNAAGEDVPRETQRDPINEINRVQNALTWQPRTAEGQRLMGWLGNAMQAIVEPVSKGVDYGLEKGTEAGLPPWAMAVPLTAIQAGMEVIPGPQKGAGTAARSATRINLAKPKGGMYVRMAEEAAIDADFAAQTLKHDPTAGGRAMALRDTPDADMSAVAQDVQGQPKWDETIPETGVEQTLGRRGGDVPANDPLGQTGPARSQRGSVDDTGAGKQVAKTAATRGAATNALNDELIVTHNLTENNLLKANELGGIPMPSIGIVNPNNPIKGYGDITLVADQSMVKPGARNPVFPADAYSPRQPRADTIYSRAESQKIDEFIGSIDGQDNAYRLPRDKDGRSYVYHDGETKEGLTSMLESNDYGKALFLKERGMMPPMEGDSFKWKNKVREIIKDQGLADEFAAWTKSKPKEIGVSGKQMIRTGTTDNWQPQYRAENMKNILREMRKDMREGDASNMYGAGQLRAGVTPKFKSLAEIKASRGQLKSADDIADYKDSMNNQLTELVSEAGQYSNYSDSNPFITMDVNMTRLTEVIRGQSSWDEYFPDIPDSFKVKVNEYLDELKSGATEYFEAKPQRGVGLDEFKVALLPESASSKSRKVLEDKGLKIVTYDGTEAGRKAVLQKQSHLMWSALIGALGLGAASQPPQYNALNEKRQ